MQPCSLVDAELGCQTRECLLILEARNFQPQIEVGASTQLMLSDSETALMPFAYGGQCHQPHVHWTFACFVRRVLACHDL
jgi:hypothetical protein